MTNEYETGMKITYDFVSKRAVLSFRGRLVVLPATFETEAEAKASAESYCRRHGWNPASNAFRAPKLRSAW